ncbi:hypothetical protein DQQ10_26365 [Pseudochryseolinea flava]|uniref:Uncharacterized protein n=2 Tax=Pseudochryseolinea flava TaxID=2059302 RepID=A0A364XUS9_9BACT|nr:hypothetical protein DQQ10_26365 [Pseudochryseolinea flava]
MAQKSAVIGTMVTRPNAILVLNPPDRNQGFLLPQLSTAERLSITPAAPADNGLIVFDTDEKSFYFWKDGAWVKGLGADAVAQFLTFDATTQTLSLTGAGNVDLSSLKEIPSVTGNDGRFLKTDGTTLVWESINSVGDITAVNSSNGLSGGATSGDVTLSVNTDGATITTNGANALQLADAAVTNAKLAPSAVNSNSIADGSINTADLSNGAVDPTKIASGGNDKVLTTTAGGVVTWLDRSTFADDNQNLSLTGNTLNIDGGTGVDLNDVTVAGGQITGTLDALTIQTNAITDVQLADNAVDAAAIQTNAVTSAELADAAVDAAAIQDGIVGTTKITSGGNDKVLTTTAGGVVSWADRSTFTDDNQNLSLTGNTLNIDGGTGVDLNDVTVAGGQIAGTLDALTIQTNAITDVQLADNAVDAAAIQTNAVTSAELADAAVDAAAIQDGVVGTIKITSGGNDKVLTTTAGGVVSWADRSTFTDDNQNLSLIGNTLNIDGGTGVDLSDVTAAGGQIAGTLDALTIQTNAITDVQLADNAVDAAAIQTNAVTSAELADAAVDAAAIQDGVVGTTKITSGGNDKVLTTTAGGVVSWADRSTFTDDNQNLSLAGNTLNIDGGTGVDLNDVTVAGGQITGTLDELTVQTNAITDVQLADNAVDAAAIQTNAVTSAELADAAVDAGAIQDGVVGTTKITSGGNDKVLTTTAGGVVSWADRSTFTDDNQNLSLTGNTLNIVDGTGVSLDPLTISGDVAGTVNATTVTKLQGRNVSSAAPPLNSILVWNGTTWVPQTVTAVGPTTQYYAVDPSAFQGLEPTNGSNETVLGLYQDDNTFVTANGDGRQIMAPVNLPDGATIQNVTAYYSDLSVLGDFTISLYRKSFTSGNEVLASRSTLLVTVGIVSFNLIPTALFGQVVDNSQYSYRVHVTFTASSQGPGLLDQRLYGIRIEYTK